MQQQNPSDFKRMLTTAAVAIVFMMAWQHFFPPAQPQQQQAAQQQTAAQPQAAPLGATVPVSVETDTVKATIDEKSGDLRGLTLQHYDATHDTAQRFTLLADGKPLTYVAQSNLVDANGNNILANANFQAASKSQTLNGDKLEVRLTAPAQNGVQVDKIYTFTKGSYLVNVRFEVKNTSSQAVKLGTSYQIVRDNSKPAGEGWFTSSYVGPIVYTPDADAFQKVQFATLDKDFDAGKDTAEYQRKASGGYVGMIQHYFASAWIMQPENGENLCTGGSCTIGIKRLPSNLYSAGVNTAAVDIPAGGSKTFAANLYAGPQVTSILKTIAPKFELTKDYGRVHIFASPLFALLNWLHGIIGNWGWAIIVLTLIVKAILFPLNQKAYKSMAKMRAVQPKMDALKKKYPNPEDRMAMQQELMKLYRDEKINPLGGCLPMLIQMPIFIGLYWMIFLSVELRQAPWLGWIHDLSRPDPFYILPILMAVTMYLQTKMSPPPSDPTQAQMMKIMPLMFSVMFFFFPAALVLYYVVNNLLTIAQQWLINRQTAAAAPANGAPKAEVLDKEPTKNKKKK